MRNIDPAYGDSKGHVPKIVKNYQIVNINNLDSAENALTK